MIYKRVEQIAKCSHQWTLLPVNLIKMVSLIFFLFILTSTTEATINSPQTTTEDPNIVILRQQLEEVARQREATRQQDLENRRKENQMRETEKKLREFEASLQQADVIRQREEAEKKQNKNSNSQNQPSVPQKPIDSKNPTIEQTTQKKQDLAETDEKRIEIATQLLKGKYLRGDKHNDTIISETLNQCQIQNCSSIAIKQAVEKILQKIKITTLIKTERKLNPSIAESTLVYKFVSDKIPKNDYSTWIELAIRVKEIMALKASTDVTNQLSHIRYNKVPNIIQNLIFPTLVCIKNIKFNEFLYAASSPELWYDNYRRHTFTRLGGSRNDTRDRREFIWKLKSINGTNEFFVINSEHNEHLFVDDSKWDESNRFAFTWTGNGTVAQNVWQIALNSQGRYFEIKNTHNQEYLFADYDRIFNDKMRCVFTHTSGTNNVDGFWDFINCSSEK